MRAITATVTPGSANLQAMIRMDNYATAVLGGQIVALGGASYTLNHSCDDPCDLVSPVPLNSMWWDNSLLPLALQGIVTVSGSFKIMACPLWFRLVLVNGQGSVRVTLLQVGEHSHSNITQGPFAPAGAVDDGVPEGSNFRAMGK
jgi:hypothetical protein